MSTSRFNTRDRFFVAVCVTAAILDGILLLVAAQGGLGHVSNRALELWAYCSGVGFLLCLCLGLVWRVRILSLMVSLMAIAFAAGLNVLAVLACAAAT